MKISSSIEDIIWHNQRKFCKVLLFHAWMVRAVIWKMLFLSEHAMVYRWAYFISAKILYASTKNLDAWPPNSPELIRLTIMFTSRCWRSSVTKILSRRTSRNWSQRLQKSGMSYHKFICKSITDFRKRLRACVNAEGGHFEHLLQRLL